MTLREVRSVLRTSPDITRAMTTAFLVGCGEQLWRRFIPKYLESFGAPITAIGLFGTMEDLLDGVLQYPGGWIADRYGRRSAILAFVVAASAGYVLYAVMPHWWYALPALAMTMAWSSMGSPAMFAVIGDSLPIGQRTLGFTLHSILRRVPITVAPVLGGMMIGHFGARSGTQLGLCISLVMSMVALIAASRIRRVSESSTRNENVTHVWSSFPTALKHLLLSDICIRLCEGMAGVFIVLYATNVIGISAPEFGILLAIQAVTSMLAYVPATRLANATGKKPFVMGTFVAFALFPLAVVAARSFAMLVVAFVVGGLREIGEPSRKGMIVDLAEPQFRARVVGLYYLCRSMAIAPAAVVGGVLWGIRPSAPFFLAALFGLVGVVLFVFTVEEQHAS